MRLVFFVLHIFCLKQLLANVILQRGIILTRCSRFRRTGAEGEVKAGNVVLMKILKNSLYTLMSLSYEGQNSIKCECVSCVEKKKSSHSIANDSTSLNPSLITFELKALL